MSKKEKNNQNPKIKIKVRSALELDKAMMKRKALDKLGPNK